jgi:hypothetical protein
MARRWIVTAIVAAALVVAAIVAARAIRNDDTDAAGRDRVTTSTAEPSTTGAASTIPTTSATSTPATTAPASTTTVAPASGEPPGPCGTDTGAIRAAIDAAVAGAQGGADVASCRRAPSDTAWAAVELAAKPGAQFDAVTVIVHGGAGSWTIVATGGTNAGCGQAPQQVIVDLGQFCAGTGGGGA